MCPSSKHTLHQPQVLNHVHIIYSTVKYLFGLVVTLCLIREAQMDESESEVLRLPDSQLLIVETTSGNVIAIGRPISSIYHTIVACLVVLDD